MLEYAEHVGIDLDDTELENNYQEAYQGEYDSELDYAEKTFNELNNISPNVQYFIDYQKYADELFTYSGDFFSIESINGEFHIFRSI